MLRPFSEPQLHGNVVVPTTTRRETRFGLSRAESFERRDFNRTIMFIKHIFRRNDVPIVLHYLRKARYGHEISSFYVVYRFSSCGVVSIGSTIRHNEVVTDALNYVEIATVYFHTQVAPGPESDNA